MRDNSTNTTSVNALNLNAFPEATVNEKKSVSISVSSNVYYGYQRLTLPQIKETGCEPMIVEYYEDFNNLPINSTKKRTRDAAESIEPSKKKSKIDHKSSEHLLLENYNKMLLEEELLHNIHGCNSYHWVSSNNSN